MVNSSEVMVDWAKLNEWIPIRCIICGALFSTQNTRYKGANPVKYAIDYALDPDPIKAKELSYARGKQCVHNRDCLKPDSEVYIRGKW